MTLVGIFGPAFWLGLWHGWRRKKNRRAAENKSGAESN